MATYLHEISLWVLLDVHGYSNKMFLVSEVSGRAWPGTGIMLCVLKSGWQKQAQHVVKFAILWIAVAKAICRFDWQLYVPPFSDGCALVLKSPAHYQQ